MGRHTDALISYTLPLSTHGVINEEQFVYISVKWTQPSVLRGMVK